jgi:O-antigen/teichoic acid export membrane protein
MRGILNDFAGVLNLLLWGAVPIVLLWFLYRAILRKILRMKRIAAIRSKRELLEAAKKDLHEK